MILLSCCHGCRGDSKFHPNSSSLRCQKSGIASCRLPRGAGHERWHLPNGQNRKKQNRWTPSWWLWTSWKTWSPKDACKILQNHIKSALHKKLMETPGISRSFQVTSGLTSETDMLSLAIPSLFHATSQQDWAKHLYCGYHDLKITLCQNQGPGD